MAWPIIRTKALFRLWWIPLNHKPKAISGKKPNFLDSGKDLLIVGELSNRHRNLVQVPKGFVAVYVGQELRRYVIPASYLSMQDFRVLMERVAEEFGYEQEGGLRIPCEEEDFEDILARCFVKHQMMSKTKKKQ